MRLAEMFAQIAGSTTSIKFVAYDGSHAGPADALVQLELRSPLALSHLASAPGELGLARAYVTGALEVHGDMYTALVNMPPIRMTDIPAEVRRAALLRLLAARLWWP